MLPRGKAGGCCEPDLGCMTACELGEVGLWWSQEWGELAARGRRGDLKDNASAWTIPMPTSPTRTGSGSCRGSTRLGKAASRPGHRLPETPGCSPGAGADRTASGIPGRSSLRALLEKCNTIN